MEPTKYIWMDGGLIDWDDANVHVLSHTLHYGMGVFEGIRFYETGNGPAVFRLKEHVARLVKGAETTCIDLPYSGKELEKAIVDTIVANGVPEGYIRPIVFYGMGGLGLVPNRNNKVHCCIAVWAWGRLLGDNPVKIKTSPYIRLHPDSTHTDAKICGHYVNSIFATVEASRSGFDEALLMDYEGYVAEGAGENIFMVKDGVLYTPSLDTILPGITRDSVIQLAGDLGVRVVEKKLRLEELKGADEVFFTGTAAEIHPISQIDERVLAQDDGPVTQKLKYVFQDAVRGRRKEYDRWLTYIRKSK